MNVNFEYVDPFDEKYNYLMRVEHLGRYYFAANILKNSKQILDVACANGYGTYILSETATKVTGMDRNESYLEIAKEKYHADNITYRQVNLDDQAIDGEYDGIVCFETIEHLKHPERFLKNLYSILEKHGTLILSSFEKAALSFSACFFCLSRSACGDASIAVEDVLFKF